MPKLPCMRKDTMGAAVVKSLAPYPAQSSKYWSNQGLHDKRHANAHHQIRLLHVDALDTISNATTDLAAKNTMLHRPPSSPTNIGDPSRQ